MAKRSGESQPATQKNITWGLIAVGGLILAVAGIQLEGTEELGGNGKFVPAMIIGVLMAGGGGYMQFKKPKSVGN